AGDEGGAYFEARLPDGSSVVGTARDEAHARRVIESMQDGRGYPCDHCAGVVAYDGEARRWVHRYGGGDVRCYPPKPRPTAWPAPPATRDRPYRRGLWGASGSADEQHAGEHDVHRGAARDAEHDVAPPEVQRRGGGERDRDADPRAGTVRGVCRSV